MGLMLDPNAKRLFWYLFAGSRGGNNRIKIIELLKEHPFNINQLAETLKLDYKAIQHHISVLEKNNMVSKVGEKMVCHISFLTTLNQTSLPLIK